MDAPVNIGKELPGPWWGRKKKAKQNPLGYTKILFSLLHSSMQPHTQL